MIRIAFATGAAVVLCGAAVGTGAAMQDTGAALGRVVATGVSGVTVDDAPTTPRWYAPLPGPRFSPSPREPSRWRRPAMSSSPAAATTRG